MNHQVEKSKYFCFPKKEKLCNEKDISNLFKKSKSIYLYPFKLYYFGSSPVGVLPKILFSVPKKNFKKAVDRNNIKRKLREAYRLNKFKVLIQAPTYYFSELAIVYIAKENIIYHTLEEKLNLILLRLKNNN